MTTDAGASGIALEVEDSRRLTGPNLFGDEPGAAMEVVIRGGQPDAVVDAWRRQAGTLLAAVGRDNEALRHRLHRDGATLVITAPIDACYAMCELNEAAWAAVRHQFDLDGAAVDDAVVARLRQEFADEQDDALRALEDAAARHGAPFLWDDDEVSVGFGASARVWPRGGLPAPGDVDWSAARAIPVGLVTGTNGKSTTVRMAASILRADGRSAGMTSTDFIRVGDEVLDTGDYSGPGGARMLLRHPRTDVAVLEVARGGMLRRGLGVTSADAALITNVAADHLGEYGIHSVDDLLPAKFVVRQALHGDAPLILCADDPASVRFAMQHGLAPVTWFGLDPESEPLREAAAAGSRHYTMRDDVLVRIDGDNVTPLIDAHAVPAALGGLAKYNLRNALGAAALTTALGASDAAIREGLASFNSDATDNPGRGNLFDAHGVRILVDFAHNEHGVAALAEAVRGLAPKRCLLLMGQAGDRLDDDIRALTRAAIGMRPDRLLACALPGYERGREPMDAPRLIREAAVAGGLPDGAIELLPEPVAGVERALEEARDGDLLVLLALTQRDAVLERIRKFVGTSSAIR